MQLTPDFLGGSLILILITYFIAFAFQLYMAYLNWKQSRVNNQMDDLLKEVRSIREMLGQTEKDSSEPAE